MKKKSKIKKIVIIVFSAPMTEERSLRTIPTEKRKISRERLQIKKNNERLEKISRIKRGFENAYKQNGKARIVSKVQICELFHL